MVALGQPAPDFELPNQDNQPIRLSSLHGRKVVLFFFPKANEFSFGCIAQACAFRDESDDLKEAGAVVFGISADTPKALKGWGENHRIKYDLLSDAGFKVHALYGTQMNVLGGVSLPWTNRSYFVIDENGMIADMEVGSGPIESAKKALEAVRKLNAAAV